MQDLIPTETEAKIAMSLRTMAQPADMETFWQRQKILTQGRIEDPAIKESWWKKIWKCLSGRDAAI
jgi:hypothetical protein